MATATPSSLKGPRLLIVPGESMTALLSKKWPGDPVTEGGRFWGNWALLHTFEHAKDLAPQVVLDIRANGEGYPAILEEERVKTLKWALEEGIPLLEVDAKEVLEKAGAKGALCLWLDGAQPREIINTLEAILEEKLHLEEREEEPLPDALSLVPVVPFPWRALPQSLVNIFNDLGEALAVFPEVAATLGLGVLSGVIGNGIQIRVKDGWEEGVSLWAAFVKKRPGYGGTPVLKALVKPIKKRQAEIFQLYERELADWEATNRDDRGPKPVPKHLFLQNSTVEALLRRLSGNSRGLVWVCDELGGWLKGLNQYKKGRGNDLEVMLSIWARDAAKLDRVAVDDLVFCESPSLAVVGSVQAPILVDLLDQRAYDGGLAARFLFVYPTGRRPGMTIKGWETQEEWEAWISRAYEIDQATVTFSLHALQELIEFKNQLDAIEEYLPNRLQTFPPKIHIYAVRLAGLLHCLEALDKGTSLSRVLKVETVRRAIALSLYFFGQARAVVELHCQDFEGVREEQRALAQAILEQENSVKNGKILLGRVLENYNARVLEQFRLTSSKALRRALEELEELLKIKFEIKIGRYDDKYRAHTCLLWNSRWVRALKRISAPSVFSEDQINQLLTFQKYFCFFSADSVKGKKERRESRRSAEKNLCVSASKTEGAEEAELAENMGPQHVGESRGVAKRKEEGRAPSSTTPPPEEFRWE